MDWQEEFKRKYVTADEAVKVVKSGDKVFIPIDTEAQTLLSALIRRKDELENVKILLRNPRIDLGWLQNNLSPSFHIMIDTQAGAGSKILNEKRLDFIPFVTSLRFKYEEDKRRISEDIDVVMIVVSPPDRNGFCSFGIYLSHKLDYTRRAKKVLAEVKDATHMMVKTFGDNYIHVSQIDYFVPHAPFPHSSISSKQKPGKNEKNIAEYVSTLIHDGDTIQMGPGLAVTSVPELGGFDGKCDLGCHSAFIGPELLKLIRNGVINGKRKNINPGKAVSGGFMEIESKEDLSFIDGNPVFEVRNMSYINNIRVIASHDHMVAINSPLAIDLSGQLAVDSLQNRMYGGAGGQVDFVMGAMLSKGGCSIAVMHSTASGGTISRIVPALEQGTLVSIPFTFADYVVTEYGIAKLWGKSLKQRAQELIAIAHPNFQPELKKKLAKLY